MNKKGKYFEKYLETLYQHSPIKQIGAADRVVIWSDLHLGDGGSRDDFRANSGMFQATLKEYYLPADFLLVLNGDIEEYLKFSPFKVQRAWESVFLLFGEFARKDKLVQIWGNHDEILSIRPGREGPYEGFRLTYKGKWIFIFHGHQVSPLYHRPNRIVGFLARYLVRPLGIMNGSVSHSNKKKYKTEQRIYEFSSNRNIVSIIGHTHRPLFESLSKVDMLKFRIEELCRIYPTVDPEEKLKIQREIQEIKIYLTDRLSRGLEEDLDGSIYEHHFMVPSLFNSGSATGRGGITCLEIQDGNILLVHWVDAQRGKHHLDSKDGNIQPLGSTGYYRIVLKEESLDYIFARLELL